MYYYENPLNHDRYQVPVELVDTNLPVYLDEAENIWHKGEILENSSSGSSRSSSSLEAQQVTHSIQRIVTNQSIPSSTTSINLGKTVKLDDMYNLKFLTPDFKFVGNNLPEDKDILERRDNIRGINLINLIEELRRVNPYGKFYAENLTHGEDGFLL